MVIFRQSERAVGSVVVLGGPRRARWWWLSLDNAKHVVSRTHEPEEVVWGCGVAFDQVGRAIGPGLVPHGTREEQLPPSDILCIIFGADKLSGCKGVVLGRNSVAGAKRDNDSSSS